MGNAFVVFLVLATCAADKGGPATDKELVPQALADGIATTRFAELAEKRSKNENVKALARRVLRDHKKWNDKLLELAGTLKAPLAPERTKEQRAALVRLSKLEAVSKAFPYRTRV